MRTLPVFLTYLGITLMAVWPLPSLGACTINITAGNDTSTCDSGAAPGFTDTAGNNTLNLSGSGSLNGDVTLGAGNDLVDINGATAAINGMLHQGDGANTFRLTLGAVTGSITQGDGVDLVQINGGHAGAIIQGGGIDSFVMRDGTVESLAQGDGHDTFVMSGGTIKGAFEDGDQALMTGGTIGRVDMKLDNNVFDMRGGTIVGNLVTGLGRDTILVSGTSTIGGNISTSAGVDLIQVSGGRVNGQILTSFGADQFIWTDGGTINGAILMGADDDSALLKNLRETLLAATPQLDGGVGNDTLTFDATQTSVPSRYTGWEQVSMINGSALTLGGTFVLGGSDTGTGAMSIDATSRLIVTTGTLAPFTSGQLATLNNAGLIDMSTYSSSTTDSLTVNGNYIGTGGRLALQTVLGADNSPSDKLVVSQGTLQGATAISITNLGGAGALTVKDGIEVVQATQGATSSVGAFSLAGPVSAGAFDYHLFRGGVTAGTEQNYYLRSTVPAQPTPDAVITPPTPAPGTPALPPNPGNTAIPLYRAEVPVYAVLFQAAEQIVQGMLGTYHERVGDQRQQQQTGVFPTGWARVYGGNSRQSFAGTVSPTLDSSLSAFQVGSDLYATSTDSGQTHRLGFFVGHSRLQGDVKGFNGGFQDKDAGRLTLRGDSLGAYWTLIGANRAYLDLVVMGTRFTGNNESDRGIKMKTKGSNALASAEAGWPFTVSAQWKLEPQAQLIVDRTRLDSQNDRISAVSYDADTHVTTRLGARLRGSYEVSGMPLQPYVRANVWHARAGTNTVRFDDATDINTEQKSTTLDLNVGATLTVAQGISLYGQLGYNRNLDSNALNGRQGTLGLRMDF
ncbi:autotransporter outer membrane beta-barrel domain-containing protein [Pseudomonas sp. 2995-3]|uniref:autotransporter family protein n=1 Tax=Pseudomonas sp. 2995-3 TaxID=1712680 RepID=UPI000C1620A1|nr:autotransporter outer membrane beta-barrel domain-containing protein [Pseudomonas sp. 2995-3]PIB62476.1 transporter [Pseudomonas sp. 2995-3]